MTQVFLWILAFIVPSFALGVPVPHTPYIVVPVLAASTGLADRHAFRRVVIWFALVLFYERIFHVPSGMLAGPVVLMAGLHVVAGRVIRFEPVPMRGRITGGSVIRGVAVTIVWGAGLILLSVLWGTFVHAMTAPSFSALYAVWWRNGAAIRMLIGMFLMLLVMHAERVHRVRTVFSDHAVIQANNVSD